MDLYTIRNMLSQGKSIYDLPLRVTFYARVSTDRYEQLNSLENQVMYFENFIKEANTGEGIKFPRQLRFYISYILPFIVLAIFLYEYINKFFLK